MLSELWPRVLAMLRLTDQSQSNAEADLRQQSPVFGIRDAPDLSIVSAILDVPGASCRSCVVPLQGCAGSTPTSQRT